MWLPKVTYTVDLKAYNDSQRIGARYSFNGFSLASWLIIRSWTFFFSAMFSIILFEEALSLFSASWPWCSGRCHS